MNTISCQQDLDVAKPPTKHLGKVGASSETLFLFFSKFFKSELKCILKVGASLTPGNAVFLNEYSLS